MPTRVATTIDKATETGKQISSLFAKIKTKYAPQVITAACAMWNIFVG